MRKMLSTDRAPDVSVIVPAYNEEKRIRPFLDRLINVAAQSSFSYEILVVTDGCTDSTQEVIKQYCKESPAIRLVTFPRKLGKGGALKLGFHNSYGPYLIYMDADGGYEPREIPRFLNALKTADCAIGSRTISGAQISYSPISRRIAGFLFALLVNLLLLGEIADTQAGFKGFKREVIDRILAQVSANGFDMDVQLLVRAKNNGFKLAQVPISYKFVEGSKVSTFKDGFLMGLRVLIFWFRLTLEQHGLSKSSVGRNDAR
jgi:dolichyl-phosphate beta-glucosyltransferase